VDDVDKDSDVDEVDKVGGVVWLGASLSANVHGAR
jgi:hypothetical protein